MQKIKKWLVLLLALLTMCLCGACTSKSSGMYGRYKATYYYEDGEWMPIEEYFEDWFDSFEMELVVKRDKSVQLVMTMDDDSMSETIDGIWVKKDLKTAYFYDKEDSDLEEPLFELEYTIFGKKIVMVDGSAKILFEKQ